MSPSSPLSGPGEAYRRFLARLAQIRRQGVALGLDRVRLALERVGSPEARVPALHIAGTNGKGSCAAISDAILRAAGFRTGLFTSPHLTRFTERIRIDGDEVDGDYLAELDAVVAETGVPLTYFEVSTVLAFLAFARAKVDVAVLETGLGGRLDATSTCRPLVCAITSIALDHEAILGHTIREIAFEKASIARADVPLYLGPLVPEAEERVREVAGAAGAPVLGPGRYPPAPTAPALAGAHQLANAALAVAISSYAARACARPLTDEAVRRGLGEVRWPGRLERIGDVLLDCAHNVEGTQALVAALPEAPRRVLVTSIVRDKNAEAMLAVLGPHFDRIVVTQSPSERAIEPERLADLVFQTRSRAGSTKAGGQAGSVRDVRAIVDPAEALAHARIFAAEVAGGLVVVSGSIFLVGALRAALLSNGPGDGLTIEVSDPLP